MKNSGGNFLEFTDSCGWTTRRSDKARLFFGKRGHTLRENISTLKGAKLMEKDLGTHVLTHMKPKSLWRSKIASDSDAPRDLQFSQHNSSGHEGIRQDSTNYSNFSGTV